MARDLREGGRMSNMILPETTVEDDVFELERAEVIDEEEETDAQAVPPSGTSNSSPVPSS